jgi:site-specific recombinase XerD
MYSNERLYFIAKTKHKKNIEQVQVKNCYENFTAYLQSKNISEKNIHLYQKKSQTFLTWLESVKDIAPENAQQKHILDYLECLQNQNLATPTRAQILSILKHYFTFLHQLQLIKTNPTLLIKLRGANKKILTNVLTLDQMNALLDAYYQIHVRNTILNTHVYQRNYLMLCFFCYQGLKTAELLQIQLSDIDLQKATVHIASQRKTASRTLKLEALQMGILIDYLNNHRLKFKYENNLLINSKPALDKLSKTIKKIDPNFIDFKQLRASIITHWISSKNLRQAQYQAGHRYISSTENYLANDVKTLQESITKYHPL